MICEQMRKDREMRNEKVNQFMNKRTYGCNHKVSFINNDTLRNYMNDQYQSTMDQSMMEEQRSTLSTARTELNQDLSSNISLFQSSRQRIHQELKGLDQIKQLTHRHHVRNNTLARLEKASTSQSQRSPRSLPNLKSTSPPKYTEFYGKWNNYSTVRSRNHPRVIDLNKDFLKLEKLQEIKIIENDNLKEPSAVKSKSDQVRNQSMMILKQTGANLINMVRPSVNHHANFKDYTIEFREQKRQRALQFAQKIMDKIGKYLIEQIHFREHMIRCKEYQNGLRYSFSELKELKDCLKQDYFEEILAYDDRISEQVAQIHAKVVAQHVEQIKFREQLDSVKDIWEQGKEIFNELIEDKLSTVGYAGIINSHGVKEYKFDEKALKEQLERRAQKEQNINSDEKILNARRQYQLFRCPETPSQRQILKLRSGEQRQTLNKMPEISIYNKKTKSTQQKQVYLGPAKRISKIPSRSRSSINSNKLPPLKEKQ